MEGYIKLHRVLLEDHLFQQSTPVQKTILITLLLMASHRANEWEWKGERYTVQPGQFITSVPKIASRAGNGVSIQNVKTALNRFEKHGFLICEPTNHNRLITIVNWGKYQSSKAELTDEVTDKKQRKQPAPKKEKSKKYSYEDVHYQLAEHFLNQIRRNNKDFKKPNLEQWAQDVRLMMEKDNRTTDQVKYLMSWVQQDDFEMTVVLSPSKLRKRFDQLVIKVKQQKKQTAGYEAPPSPQQNKLNRQMAFQEFIDEGGDPEDFNWSE